MKPCRSCYLMAFGLVNVHLKLFIPLLRDKVMTIKSKTPTAERSKRATKPLTGQALSPKHQIEVREADCVSSTKSSSCQSVLDVSAKLGSGRITLKLISESHS